VTKVQKRGNSQGLRLSKEVLDEAQIGIGDEVNVSVRCRRIIVQLLNKVRGRYCLQELVAKIPKEYRAEEVEWGEPVGKEAWQVPRYVPKQGDFVVVNFDPQSDHEQKGRHPALVVSKTAFNRHTGMAMLISHGGRLRGRYSRTLCRSGGHADRTFVRRIRH
jgi:antitoxin MazE